MTSVMETNGLSELAELAERFPRWRFHKTPLGTIVAQRKKAFLLNDVRVDLGFRSHFYHRSKAKLVRDLEAQERLHEQHGI